MKALDENYSFFEKLMNEERLYLNPGLTFEIICGWLGADAGEMDGLLLQELGLDGEALLKSLRKSFPERLERKYGIRVEADLFFKDVIPDVVYAPKNK